MALPFIDVIRIVTSCDQIEIFGLLKVFNLLGFLIQYKYKTLLVLPVYIELNTYSRGLLWHP